MRLSHISAVFVLYAGRIQNRLLHIYTLHYTQQILQSCVIVESVTI